MRTHTTGAGQTLRKLRRAAGLSLSELARQAGLNKGIVSRIENDRQPIARYASQLAQVLGDEVFGIQRPGQLRLALDWSQAIRRDDLDEEAKRWLRERAKLSLHDDAYEVWQIGGAFVFAPAELAVASGGGG